MRAPKTGMFELSTRRRTSASWEHPPRSGSCTTTGKTASFTNAHNALFKAIKSLPEQQQAVIKEVVPLWRAARGKLMNHTIQTLTALKAANATLDNPVSYGNINPDELIRTFNYGASLPLRGCEEQPRRPTRRSLPRGVLQVRRPAVHRRLEPSVFRLRGPAGECARPAAGYPLIRRVIQAGGGSSLPSRARRATSSGLTR